MIVGGILVPPGHNCGQDIAIISRAFYRNMLRGTLLRPKVLCTSFPRSMATP